MGGDLVTGDARLEKAWNCGGRICDWPAEHLDRLPPILKRQKVLPQWLRDAQRQIDARPAPDPLMAERYGSPLTGGY